MKNIVTLFRHGESVDDLTNQYGGWGDFGLTPSGVNQIRSAANSLYAYSQKNGINFSKILSSPLLRAQQSARIIANRFSLSLEVDVYLKERNGYGLLSGLNKEFAKENYPELVRDMNRDDFLASESSQDFSRRVDAFWQRIANINEDLILVSHGGFIRQFSKQILGKSYASIGDGGYILFEYVSGTNKNTKSPQISLIHEENVK